ncbi:uncharacterized protein si:dkeyp-97a10.3 isoform X2 [Hoplias malabaricus]|uniref:uncharacterized protein si:dkeyp-97a10.3 isoform X2 n=1 Tax=Hoplias malabaricus TaxID=27720 RepID=UPI0034621DB5
MNKLPHPWFVLTLTVLPWTTESQSPVPLQFQTSPVLVATENNAVFAVQTISNPFSITWIAPGDSTLGQWVGGQAVYNSVPQYQGRVTITATQLTINSCQRRDAGNYTVRVVPLGTTGLSSNSLSVALRVFEAVGSVTLFVPSVAIEGGNVSFSCSWTQGTETSVAWAKGGSALTSDSHITINGGSLIINPVSRTDAGQYSCTVSNPISTQTATATLTVNYGPDTPQVSKSSANCVGGGDVTVGQTIKLTCTSVSLPPAQLSWQYNGNQLTGGTTDGTLNLQVFSTIQSGQYLCMARNAVTLGTSQQQISVSVVGTCLSGGAVAGIVVACFVVLVLIIVAIVLLVRQRNVDRTLRNVTGQRKTNLNNGPAVLPAEQNGQVTSGVSGNGGQPDPPLHYTGRRHLPNNQEPVTVWHTGQENNETLTQNHTRLNNTNLNTGPLPNNGHQNFNDRPYNGHQNSNSYPHNGLHNSSVFPQSGQQNPNILIQTGHGDPGGQTVLINLNPMPHTEPRNATAQAPTVQVSLNAPQSSQIQPNQSATWQTNQQNNTPSQQIANANQPNQSATWHNAQQNTLPQQIANTNQQHLPDLQSTAQPRMENLHNPAQTAVDSTLRIRDQAPNGRIPTGYSHHPDPNLTNRQSRNPESSLEIRHRRSNDGRSRSPDPMSSSSTNLRQRPWDQLRGTPAYPNPESVDSETSQYQTSTQHRTRRRSGPRQSPRQTSAVDAPMSPASATRSRAPRDTSSVPNPQTDLNLRWQDVVRDVGLHQHSGRENQAASQITVPQSSRIQNTGVSERAGVPQNPRSQGQDVHHNVFAHQNQTALLHTIPQNPEIYTHGTPNTGVNQTRVPQNLPTQGQVQRSVGAHHPPVPQNPIQAHGTPNTGVSQRAGIPQNQHTLAHAAQLPQARTHTNANSPNAAPLTQAALQMHTNHTPNPFPSRIQQTQAVLQHPRPAATPGHPNQTQPQPTAEKNQRGQRPPTPPPVLGPSQFRTLPREPLRQPRTLQPAHVARQPRGQRPHNVHGHARPSHTSPHRHTGNQALPHVSAHRHGNGPAHRLPPHLNQVHRHKPRL